MSVYSTQEICSIVCRGEAVTANPDVAKYEKICDDISDLLRNSESHDRFTAEELCLITDAFIMLKSKAASEEKKKAKCRFSRYAEMRFKYQEERLKAHSQKPKDPEPKPEPVPEATLAVVAEFVDDFGEELAEVPEDLTKSVIMHIDDNIV